MEKMKLWELRDYLNSLSDSEIEQSVILYDSSLGEYYNAEVIVLTDGDEFLDPGTILIQFES